MTEKSREAYEALEKHGSAAAAAKALGISRKAFRDRIARGRNEVTDKLAEDKPKQAAASRSLEEFRKTYDKDLIVPAKIREAIKALGDGWVYEQEFTRLANVSYNDLSIYRELFADHIVVIKKDSRKVWAGTPELAEEMRRML